ncbi:MAG: PASTA domain-containing protein [Candidatus Krumholzibacteria bacterium]|nr:PASTA domain-containing protein [Candidatus Krumholzibacteria bacterium]
MSSGKRIYHPVIFYAAVIVGAFLLGILIFNKLIIPGLVGRGDVVIVPDLKGMSVKIAEEKCRDSGLVVTVVGNRNSTEVPEGYVIEQDPGPADGLKKGRAIRLVVSAGCRMEVIPELRNRSLRQAELLLESSGLKRGRVVRVFSHEEGQNCVFSTSPPVGSTVPRASRVDILLSMRGEPRKYLMPDLIGMDLPFVKAGLDKIGFSITRVVSRRVADKFPNTILSQSPESGSCIKEGGTIELVVSTVE